MKANMKILAGIVTYNPDVSRLNENVSAIFNQVDSVLIVDNGSSNLKEFKNNLNKKFDIVFIENSENLGIAKALSQIMDYAIKNNFDWVLTLDDDSVVKKDLIEKYLVYANIKNVGIISCLLKDRNFSVPQNVINGENNDYIVVRDCISSGSFINVSAYNSTHGYDEELFIDWVDNDICYEFAINGFKTIKINYVGLLCEISHTQIKRFLWKSLQINNYSPFRRYYRSRNEIIIANRYPQIYKRYPFIINLFVSFNKILFFEDKKVEKIKSILKGYIDARNYIRRNPNNIRINRNFNHEKVNHTLFYY